MGESLLEGCKPGLAMVVSQCIYAAMALLAKAAFARGMSPMVFSVYRQATAALVLAPINITARSLVGAVAVVGGLYIVLWGKAKDIDPKSSCSNSHLPCVSENMTVAVDPGLRDGVCGLQKPLLGESLGTQDNQMED
ncbi:hypothetical protein BHE74_00059304 [Ensete ventricosum]|nr:hypothetical protein BHE74_00059304 [Ensete ventricosum]